MVSSRSSSKCCPLDFLTLHIPGSPHTPPPTVPLCLPPFLHSTLSFSLFFLHWYPRWYHLVCNFNYHLCAEDTQMHISTQSCLPRFSPHTSIHSVMVLVWISQGHLKLSTPKHNLHFFPLNPVPLPVSFHQLHHHLSRHGNSGLSFILFSFTSSFQLISSTDNAFWNVSHCHSQLSAFTKSVIASYLFQ